VEREMQQPFVQFIASFTRPKTSARVSTCGTSWTPCAPAE
jgi:hypothetical protein